MDILGINFVETSSMPLLSKDNCGEYMDKKLKHICEVCGTQMVMLPLEGYQAGWDYAPYMYPFKIISPRNCPNCGIEKTVWAEIVLHHKRFEDLSEKQKEVVQRIYREPESIIVK